MREETIDPLIRREAKRCATEITEGKLLLYPSDTLWGLGCDASNKSAINRLKQVKNRAENKSFITLVNSWRMLNNVVAEIPPLAEDILALSTEPLTIIYPKATNAFAHLTSEDGKIAVRLVEKGFAADLMSFLHKPVISTSANQSGEKHATSIYNVPDIISEKIECKADPNLNYVMTGKPSRVILLENDGRFKIIRS